MAGDTIIAAKPARAPAAENNDKPFGWRFVTPIVRAELHCVTHCHCPVAVIRGTPRA